MEHNPLTLSLVSSNKYLLIDHYIIRLPSVVGEAMTTLGRGDFRNKDSEARNKMGYSWTTKALLRFVFLLKVVLSLPGPISLY